jgi:Ca2+-transporting ATPase
LDPPRTGVREALDRCQDAGVRVVMVTGDQPATARNVAGAVGLARKGERNLEADEIDVIHGSAFGDPDGSEQDRRHVLESSAFARVSPEQKLRLIDLHQENGSIVAMTGDGVNDAPALKSADIGVAMGRRGTEVAREASDMILQDDAFSTIVAAVEQGRVIFDNIRQFVIYLLSGNVGEILAVAIAALFSIEVGGVEVLPLLPLQILYLNVLNDVFPALALGIGPGDASVMRHPPRSADEPIITRFHWSEIVGYGALIGATILGVFFWAIYGASLGPTQVVTTSFLALSIARLLHVFNMRRPESGFISNEVTRNPWVWAALALDVGLLLLAVYWAPLAGVLKVTAPTPVMWTAVVAASVAPLVGGQLYLALRKRRASRRGSA